MSAVFNDALSEKERRDRHAVDRLKERRRHAGDLDEPLHIIEIADPDES